MPDVTDHAVVRYLERVAGMDIAAIRRAILPADVEAQVRVLGDGRYPVGETHAAIVRDGVVVTVYDPRVAYPESGDATQTSSQ
jgi:hypothetical protein